MRAATRVNAEQASKREDAEADPIATSGKAATDREASETSTGRFRRAVAAARMEEGNGGNTGSPVGGVHASTGTPRGAGRAGRVADRPV